MSEHATKPRRGCEGDRVSPDIHFFRAHVSFFVLCAAKVLCYALHLCNLCGLPTLWQSSDYACLLAFFLPSVMLSFVPFMLKQVPKRHASATVLFYSCIPYHAVVSSSVIKAKSSHHIFIPSHPSTRPFPLPFQPPSFRTLFFSGRTSRPARVMLTLCNLSRRERSISFAVATASACVVVRGSRVGATRVPLTASRRKGRFEDWMREMSSASRAAWGDWVVAFGGRGKVSAREVREICE